MKDTNYTNWKLSRPLEGVKWGPLTWASLYFFNFIEFVTILLLFYVLFFWPRGMWDLKLPDQKSNLHPLHWQAKSIGPVQFPGPSGNSLSLSLWWHYLSPFTLGSLGITPVLNFTLKSLSLKEATVPTPLKCSPRNTCLAHSSILKLELVPYPQIITRIILHCPWISSALTEPLTAQGENDHPHCHW